MKCLILFYGENKKTIISSSSAELAQRVKVKVLTLIIFTTKSSGYKLLMLH